MTISVLIATLNEEANLPRCLDSLAWCDDIVVIDSHSNDRTVDIARQRGARVLTRTFDNHAAQRNYALDNVAFKHEWLLNLDADEACTAPLLEEMQQKISTTEFDAYYLPSKMMFFGKWLRFSGDYPSYQARLGRLPAYRFKQVGHAQREDMPPERVGYIKQPYLHYSFHKGLADWFEKHNRYSTDEALEIINLGAYQQLDIAGLLAVGNAIRRRRALKALYYRLPFRPAIRFLYSYVFRLGFLDGAKGFTYCRLKAIYESMISIKLREYRRRAKKLSI